MPSNDHIRVLSDHVINKIAAGEVVERPASVLKELMENAADANGSQIEVEIGGGGRKLVAVTDNGRGMTRDDALLSLERHATSKIWDVDDIEQINTLGFRGEALAAIASVARLRLATCPEADTTGTEILVSAGTVRDVREMGCPCGTTIEVRDLFFNVPARRKFLRSAQTELGHLRSGFIVQALSHPEIGMVLSVDGRETYRLAGGTLEDRMRDLFGPDYLAQLKPVDTTAHGVTVTGFVSLPSFSRSDRSDLYVFVNGRATSAPLIGYAIREGYHTLLPSGRHPRVVLFVAEDPAQVDVNVHPTKREVRFRRSSQVRDAVIEAIRTALRTDGALPIGSPVRGASMPVALPRAATAQLSIPDLPSVRGFTYPSNPLSHSALGTQHPARTAAPAGNASQSQAPWAFCRVLGQIGGLYVLLETEDGYVVMDPHAAHERVLFERFMADVTVGTVQTQALLMPESVELRPGDAVLVRKHVDMMKQMGFGISEFGGDSFIVDAVPSCFAGLGAQRLLVEVVQDLERAGDRGGKGRWREEAIAQAACKAAVKARDHLNVAEVQQLVTDLAACEMPYTCPHGRPTLIHTSFKDLNKKFGRE